MSATGKPIRAPLLNQGADPAPRWERIDILVVVGLVLVSLALRIPGLNHGLWVDEILTLLANVRLPAVEIINQAGSLNNHVLYSLSAHYATAWLGESAWTLRLPAVVFGLAAIPATYHLGRQVAGRKEGFLAALFMGLNYQFVWYSQNARGYTGLLLGAVVTTILFIRLVTSTKPSVRLIVGYAVAAALSAWIHLTAVFVLLAHGLIWFVLGLRPNRAGRIAVVMPTFSAMLLSGFLTLALYAPMFGPNPVQHAVNFQGKHTFVVESQYYAEQILSPAAQWVLDEFIQGLQRSVPGGWPAVVVVVLVLLAGIGSYLRQSFAVAGLLLLPALITWTVMELRGMLLFPRFMIGSAAFIMLVAVRGGFRSVGFLLPLLSRRQILLMGILVALAGAAMVPPAWRPKQDYEGAMEFTKVHRLPGDAVVCLRMAHLSLHHYLGMDCEEARFASQLRQIEEAHERVWVLYTVPTEVASRSPSVWQRIKHSGEYVKIAEFEGTLNRGNIIVLLRQPGVAPGQSSR